MVTFKTSRAAGAWQLSIVSILVAINGCSNAEIDQPPKSSTSTVPAETEDTTKSSSTTQDPASNTNVPTTKEAAKATKSNDSPTETGEVTSGATPVELTRFYGMNAESFDKITTFPWPGVPRGHQEMAKVPLEIGGALMLWGERNQKMGMNYPESVDGIPVGTTCEAIYVLHSVFFEGETGKPIFSVIMNYADGTNEKETLFCGTDGRDWFANKNDPKQGPSGPRSILGWAGESTYGNKTQAIRFCLTSLANPHPEKRLETLDLVSAKSQSAACILAITVGKADLLKQPQ